MTNSERKVYNAGYWRAKRSNNRAHKFTCDCGEPAVKFTASAWVCSTCLRRDIVAKELEAQHARIVMSEVQNNRYNEQELAARRRRAADKVNAERRAITARRQQLRLRTLAGQDHAVAVGEYHRDNAGDNHNR